MLLVLLALLSADTLPPVPGVAIERRLAAHFSVAVGDTIAVTPEPGGAVRRFVIEAVYEPRPDPATALRNEYHIRFHLPDLADLLGHPDRIDRMGVAAVAGIAADSVAARLDQRAFGYRAFASDVIAAESSRTFAVVSRFHRAIGVIAIVASAVFLLCIMLLKVEERRLDAAVMRLIGISRATVVRAFVLEATLIAAVGSVLGVGLAALAGVLTNWGYQRRFDTTLVFSYLTPDIMAIGVGLSLLLGIGAGLLAARRLVAANPLALWRRAA